MLVVAAVPSLTTVSDSLRSLRGTFQTANAESQGETLAHLTRPLPLAQAGGVWLSGDYRNAVGRPALAHVTDAGLLLVGILALGGLAVTLRRREVAAAALVAAGALTYLVVAPRTSPYADAKMLAIISPALVLCGMLGAASLARRWKPIGAGAAGLLGLLVLSSAAFAYHDVNLAPRDRIDSMASLGDRYAGDHRLLLWNEYEEFAKYFMRRAVINQPTEAMTESFIELKRDLGFFGGRTFDLDDAELAYLERFPGIVTRIRPNESRPPANYRREYGDGFYEVWRRQPRPVVAEHVSLFDERARTSVNEADCAGLRDLAAKAPAGSQLVAAVQPERKTLLLPRAEDRPAWLAGLARAAGPDGAQHSRPGDRLAVGERRPLQRLAGGIARESRLGNDRRAPRRLRAGHQHTWRVAARRSGRARARAAPNRGEPPRAATSRRATARARRSGRWRSWETVIHGSSRLSPNRSGGYAVACWTGSSW